MASVSKRKWVHEGQPREAWVVRYKEGGKHRSKQFEKKKDADAFKAKAERDIADGVHIAPEKVRTVAQVAELFVKSQESRFRDGRIGQGRYVQLKTAVDHSIVPILGHRTISELTSPDIEEFYATMCRVGGKRGPLAPQTALSRVTALNLMCRYAMRNKFISGNPVPEASKQLTGIKKAVIRTFTSDEVKTLLEVADRRGYGCRPRPYLLTKIAVNLAAFCGLRLGEILGLTVENIDMTARVIKVRHNLTVWDELKGPKTPAGIRDVPLPTHIKNALTEWLARYYIDNDRGLVFRTVEGKPIQHSIFNLSNWCGLLKRAGLFQKDDVFHFHALRHFAASWMIENGLPITDVASLLGHEKFDMTLQVYAHPVVRGHRRHEVLEQMVNAMTDVPALPAPMPASKGAVRGYLPFGYKAVNGKLEPVDSEQRTLEEMRAMRAAGATLKAIGERFGKRASSVKRFLDRPTEAPWLDGTPPSITHQLRSDI